MTGKRRAPYVVSADVVLLDAWHPLVDGAVRIERGRIAAVGPAREIARPGVPRIRLRRSVLAPGLVNAHTHLALSTLSGLRPRRPGFAAWIATMAATVRELSPADLRRGVREGAHAALLSGTTAIGDIVPTSALAASRCLPFAGTRFLEVLGFGRGPADLRLPQLEPGEGIAPHAPYSTSAGIYRWAAARARARSRAERRLLALHLAESEDEVEFLRTGKGPLRALLDRRGLLPQGWRPPATSPVRYAEALGTLDRPALVIHATFAGARDRTILRRRRATVVTCPRSNLTLVGRTADVGALLGAGVPVALGTDSLASAPTLSMLDEMRALRGAHPTLGAEVILDLATRTGAEALGLEAGRIDPGRLADLAAFPIGSSDRNPAEEILRAERAGFVAIAGKVLLGPGTGALARRRRRV